MYSPPKRLFPSKIITFGIFSPTALSKDMRVQYCDLSRLVISNPHSNSLSSGSNAKHKEEAAAFKSKEKSWTKKKTKMEGNDRLVDEMWSKGALKREENG